MLFMGVGMSDNSCVWLVDVFTHLLFVMKHSITFSLENKAVISADKYKLDLCSLQHHVR